MLSSLFKPLKNIYAPCYVEVITDECMISTFHNDPYVDHFRKPHWFERSIPVLMYRKMGGQSVSRKKTRHAFISYLLNKRVQNRVLKSHLRFFVFPEWKERTFRYLAYGDNLMYCIDSANKNILSVNFALQIDDCVVEYPDLRPRIYLSEKEIDDAKKQIPPNSIGINVARIRDDQQRNDGERLRYRRKKWELLVHAIKKYDSSLTIAEIGQEQFEGIGDVFIPNKSIRTTASILKACRLVILSDGGLHNICNAVDQPVLLFQAYEMNPPDLFKMGNALFNETYHCECRKQCHLFSDILQIPSKRSTCNKECYNLAPERLAHDCILFLEKDKNN